MIILIPVNLFNYKSSWFMLKNIENDMHLLYFWKIICIIPRELIMKGLTPCILLMSINEVKRNKGSSELKLTSKLQS